ncbi:hypothetical protein CISIN_1g034455mg [Citrus sinensis]|uniref:Uncharacterized protein n=1 Tax=Citrus sinensis TaxID=2711 RepID=A0A067EWG0_CITSI|nr:hypothetical protein CISIN_1g034455mg [Citrus sinensis]
MPTRCEIFCEILLAVLLPPVGVCLRHGCCSVEFCICLLLTILGYVPGIIYALYAIVFVDRDEYFDEYRRPLKVPYTFTFSAFCLPSSHFSDQLH